ncbi:MAG: hypothetical protein V4710_06780 [Verrucomicrobiota bacterium]
MLIQKIFHVRQSLSETQNRLLELGNHLGALEGVRHSARDDQPTHLELVTGSGFYADLVLEQLPCEEPGQILFRSTGGNLEVTGLFELFEIRNDLTEVQLTLDYSVRETLPSLLETALVSIDRLITRQLRTVRTWLTTGVLQTRAPRERRLRSRMTAFRQWQFAQ